MILGIGQGYWTATPLQLANATALLATRGRHFRPRLVRALVDPATGAVERARAASRCRRSSSKDQANWEVIVDAMVAVTSGARGTAVRASRGAAYSIAGKTGTAQVYSIGQTEKYDEKTVAERLRDHALFVAFAPAEAPKLVIAVLVENGGHGSSAAAPIARAVFDAYLDAGAGLMYEELAASRTRRTMTATARLMRALHLDGMLLSGLAVVSFFGLFVLYSAAGDNTALWFSQLARFGIGIAVMVAIAQVPDHFLRMVAPDCLCAGTRAAAARRGRSATSARARSAGSTSASSASSRRRS